MVEPVLQSVVTVKLPSTVALNSSSKPSTLHSNEISRGVGFVIESGGGAEGAVGIEGEKGIVSIPRSAHQVVSQNRIGIGIGCIELSIAM